MDTIPPTPSSSGGTVSSTDTFVTNAERYPDADVRQSIARIKASPFVPVKDSIRGFGYEVETGRLREVKE
jgi:carbonic anhydrase